MSDYRNKGDRIDAFLRDYVSFGFETTDCNINYAEIRLVGENGL